MKSILALGTLMISVASYACPQLAGTYACNYDGEVEMTTITQGVQNGVTYYVSDGETILMDGQSKSFQDEGAVGYYIAQCDGNTAQIQTVADMIENGAIVGNMDTTTDLTPSQTGVVMQTTGQVNYQGQVYPINESVECTRQ